MYKIIGADLKEYGPVSAEQLRLWITEGRANGQTKVQAAGATEWKVVEDCPEFVDLLPKRPAPILAPGGPITPLPAPPRTSQLAVWAMVTGILGVLCCQILGPVAIVLGAVALSQFKTQRGLTGRGFAIVGIVLGVVALVLAIVAILLLFFSPAFLQSIQRGMPQ